MQTSNRLFDDLARVASGAFNTLSGLREEIETRVRERVERMAADLDLVTREEFVRTGNDRAVRDCGCCLPAWTDTPRSSLCAAVTQQAALATAVETTAHRGRWHPA